MSFVYDTIRIEERIDVMSNGHIVTTNKGDIIVDNGTKSSILASGSDNQVLTVNSSTDTGLQYNTLTSSYISDFTSAVTNHSQVSSNSIHRGSSSGVHGLSGSVVGTSDSQTLSNKSLVDNTTSIVHNGDNSKKVMFNLSDITVSTTRTLNIPDKNTTIVGTDTTQTLSNKTLELPRINDSGSDNAYIIGVNELTSDRTVSLPLLLGNDTFVFESHNQTLSNKTINADNNTISNLTDSNIKSNASINATKIANGSISNTEFQYLDGISSSVVGINDINTLTNKTINALNNTLTNISNTSIKAGANIDATKIANGSVSNTEFQYLDGVSSNVVGINDTQTLTNKTLTGSTTQFQDNTDNSKKMKLDMSSVSTGQTRVLTIPDANITLVGLNLAQTLTNKTINADSNTITNIDNTNIKSAAAINATKIANGSVTSAQYQRLSGVESSVVGISDSQTLTNKKLNDTTTTFQNTADTTKKVQLDISNVTTGSTRVITIPDSDLTIMGINTTQTVTNKTWGDHLDMGGYRITNIGEPDQSSDVASKQYVDAMSQGLSVKDPVRVKTVELLPTYIQDGTGAGATLTGSSNGSLPDIDDVILVQGNRLLIDSVGSSDDSHNGIYIVTDLGDDFSPWILTRAIDADTDAKVNSGMYTIVTEGTTCADCSYVLTTDNPILIDTSSLAFVQFSGSGQLTAGSGMTKDSNILNVNGSTTIIANIDDLEVNSSGIANQILLSSGTVGLASTFGALPLANSNSVSGILGLANGGTNASSFIAGSRLITTNSENTALESSSIDIDNVVTLDGSQTIMNKTFTDASTYFQDENDNTKKIQLQLSSITSGQTRLLTVPNESTTLVGTTTSQILTNKSINADNNTITNIDNDDIKSAAAIDATKIANGSVSNTQFQRLSGINSTVVGEDDSQTLTNKTLSSPKISDSGSDNTYTMLGSDITSDLDITLPLLTGNDTFVFESHIQTISNKTFTLPKINDGALSYTYNFAASNLGADRTITLPLLSGNDIFVFEGHAQTLTNKTFVDYTTYFEDNSDNSKKMQFELSGITSGQTRILTVPNESTTLIGTATTQTITNKTINANNNSITNLSNSSIKSSAAIDTTKLADGSVSNSSFQNLSGLSSKAVGISEEQVLTNKTLVDATTYFQDDLDNTKKCQLELSGITTGQTRIYNVPNQNTTLVGTGTTQILTNKTFDADENTLTNIKNIHIKSGAAIDTTKLANGSVTNAQFQRLSNIGSAAVGVTDAQTLTNKTLTSPKIETAINDGNGNELIKLSSVGGAVNEITVNNASSGNAPIISATGNDSNIDLNINPKGDGNIVLDGMKWPSSDGTASQVLGTNGEGVIGYYDVPTLSLNTTTTTNASTVTLITNETSTDTTYLVDINIVAKRTDSGSESAGFVIRGTFKNNSGTLTKVGEDKVYSRDDNEWDANITTSSTDIVVQVTGVTGKTINWKGSIKIISV